MQSKPQALATETTGPLKGVRILDMTSVVFGAYATQMLGDLGADVIKVEFPGGRRGGGGDIMRWAGHPPPGAPDDLGPIFMTINRNKRSVLLDLREDAAKTALRKLITTSDVFAASVRYDGLKRSKISVNIRENCNSHDGISKARVRLSIAELVGRWSRPDAACSRQGND